MKKLIALLLVSGAALLTGCLVTSVYPFYQQKDLAFEPALLGDWTNPKEAGEHWKFERDSISRHVYRGSRAATYPISFALPCLSDKSQPETRSNELRLA